MTLTDIKTTMKLAYEATLFDEFLSPTGTVYEFRSQHAQYLVLHRGNSWGVFPWVEMLAPRAGASLATAG